MLRNTNKEGASPSHPLQIREMRTRRGQTSSLLGNERNTNKKGVEPRLLLRKEKNANEKGIEPSSLLGNTMSLMSTNKKKHHTPR